MPVIVYNHQDKTEVINSALQLQRKLELQAIEDEKNGGRYIRPIVLFQAQPRNADDNTTFEKLKEKLIELPKSQFETDGIFDADVVKEGAIIPMMSEEDDEHMEAIVVAVDDNGVQLDFNHPLAGEILHFKGEIFELCYASKQI